MESLIGPSVALGEKFSIIGSEKQVLQVVLQKEDKIYINENCVLYSSSQSLERIHYNKVDDIFTKAQKELFKKKEEKRVRNEIGSCFIYRIRNINDNFEYMGFTREGRVMKIIPSLYEDLYISIKNVLCFSDSLFIEDVKNPFLNSFFKNFSYKQLDFFLFKSKIKERRKILLKKDEDEGNLAEINSFLKEFVYIANPNTLIEKRLGINEQITIHQNCVVAFENTLTFRVERFSHDNILIHAEGPGLIIFSNESRRSLQEKRMVTSIESICALLYSVSLFLFAFLFAIRQL